MNKAQLEKKRRETLQQLTPDQLLQLVDYNPYQQYEITPQ
jgi:hypothetical protein